MCLLRLAFWAVRVDFFRRLHIRLHSIDSVYNNKPNHIYLFRILRQTLMWVLV
jgi:hypothetical protein